MFRQLDRIPSAWLGTSMHLWRFGHWGQPLLVFPTSAGMAHEWEYNGLVETLAPFLEQGRLKLYCTESNVTEAWFSGADPAWRIARHRAFEHYVMGELVPRIVADCGGIGRGLWAAGTSLGAFYAANFLLKRPDVFSWALCLSGRYDARMLTGGFDNPDVYLSNPAAFVPHLDGAQLQWIQERTWLDLVCGQGQWEGENIEATREFARILAARGIPHRCELWGHDVAHDWVWWNRQALRYLGARLGPVG